MALRPGKIYIGRPVRLTVNFNVDDTDVDPTTVVLRVMSPDRVETTYTYAVAGTTVQRSSAGDYYCDVTPDVAGRWYYRWQGTGTDTTDASEGDFLVQTSIFYDDLPFTDYV